MKKQGLLLILTLLLVLALLAGCGQVTPVTPAETAAPAPTTSASPSAQAPAPTEKPAVTPSAEPSAKPTAEPSPEPSPEPTGEPESTPKPTAEPEPQPTPTAAPTRIGALPEDLAGTGWWLYAYETEGVYGDPWEDGVDNWLEFYSDGPLVNYYERMYYDPWIELRAADVLENADGCLCFSGEVGGVRTDFVVTALSEWELELSCTWENPDGTLGSGTRWFNKAGEYTDGRRMDSSELEAFIAGLGPTDWGFFHDTYACPQEIDWEQIAAGGLGIGATPEKNQVIAWREYSGDRQSRPVGLNAGELESLVREKTGTDYAEAVSPILWWYRDADSDLWINAYDPVCADAPMILDGYRKGDACCLYFELPTDPAAEAQGLETQMYKMDMVLAPAGWQFRSCCVAGTVQPVVLATLRYFDTREEARAATGVTSFVSTEHLESDEPDWAWVVVTAQTDEVKYRFQRASMSGENAYAMEALAGAVLPDTELCSGVLEEGGTVALEVNLAWYPHLRLELSRNYHWAEYWFDQALWNPAMTRETTRYVVGHDLDGENRGCTVYSEQGLVNVLTDGAWYITDRTGSDILGCLFFYDDGGLSVVLPDSWAGLRYTPMWEGEKGVGAPERLRLTLPADYWTGSAVDDTPIGDYALYLTQFQGEQLLTLQAKDGLNGLVDLIPAWEEGATSFYFRRYRGTTPFEGVG